MLGLGELSYLLTPIHQPVIAYDEGIVAYGATRVLHGDLPYRDFWTAYAPGQFYALAGLFALSGPNLMVARLADTLARLALAVLVYLFMARITSRGVAVLASLIVTLWLAADSNYGYAMFPALAGTMATNLCLLRYVTGGRRRWAVLGGLCAGLTLLLRHDVGLYVLLTAAVVLTLFAVAHPADTHTAGILRYRAAAPALLPFFGAAALTVMPLGLYLAVQVPAGEWWSCLVVFPLTTYRQVRARPLPSAAYPLAALRQGMPVRTYLWWLFVSWVRLYAPLMVYAASVWALLRGRYRRSAGAGTAGRWWGMLILTISGLALLTQALGRFDNVHVFPTDVPALMLLCALLACATPGRKPVSVRAAGLATCAFLAVTYLYLPARTYWGLVRAAPPLQCPPSVARAPCIRVPQAQAEAVAYLQAHARPDERIFVGGTRHDRIFANDVMLYFLAGRDSATRYHELHPGVATTRPVQQAIITDLKRDDVRYVVRFAGFDGIVEDNGSAISSGVTDLDAFIRQTYTPVARFGDYTILARTTAKSPS